MGQLADAARAFMPLAGRPRTNPDGVGAEREPATEFGRWLADEPAERQRYACLCFLVYWFACTETAPEPQERLELWAADPRTLGPRGWAKRAAWSEDPRAFADAVHRAVDATDRDQRVQFLDLLLAVRACEGERNAGENVLLRFLADVAGIRGADLGRRYERAFGTPLPGLPRLDPDDWWLARPDVDVDPTEGAEAHHRRRLGLVAHGLIADYEIGAGFEWRHDLTDPARFDRLGAYERALIGRLRTRLVEARNALSGDAP